MPHRDWSLAVSAFIFALALIPLAVTPVLPFIDFYNHVARFFVLSHVGSSRLLQQYYQAQTGLLLPDIGVDVLGTPLLYFLPPLFAAKVIACIILAIIYSGVLAFNCAISGRRSVFVAILLAPLLYSYVLNWGFANFLLGLGVTFWSAAWWVKMHQRPWLAVPISCLLAIAIFFSHGVAFLLYGVLVSPLSRLGVFLETPRRDPARLIRSLGAYLDPGNYPNRVLHSLENGIAGGGAVQTLHPSSLTLHERLTRGTLYHLRTILRVEEGPSGWFDVATFAIQLLAVGCLLWRRQLDLPRRTHFLAIVVVVLAALPLPTLFGVGYIADRIPLFAALVLVGIISVQPGEWTSTSKVLGALIAVTAFVRLAAMSVSWQPYTQFYAEFRSIAEKIPSGSLTESIAAGSGRHETGIPRCEMYGPLLIMQFGEVGPLFADEKQQPLRMIGRLKGGGAAGTVDPGYADQVVNALRAGYDYVLVCNAQLLQKPIPAGAQAVSQTEHFILLRHME